MIWRGFYIHCSCGHRNRPHKSPREGIRLTLIGQAGNCKRCGEVLQPRLSDRPLIKKVREALLAEGIKPIL